LFNKEYAMFSNDDKSRVTGSHRSLRNLVIWSTLVAGVATAATVGVMLTPKIPTAQTQSTATSSVGVTAMGDPTGVDSGLVGEPYHFDHSVVNMQNLPEEPNPAPLPGLDGYDFSKGLD
jgi:hypothetical protein